MWKGSNVVICNLCGGGLLKWAVNETSPDKALKLTTSRLIVWESPGLIVESYRNGAFHCQFRRLLNVSYYGGQPEQSVGAINEQIDCPKVIPTNSWRTREWTIDEAGLYEILRLSMSTLIVWKSWQTIPQKIRSGTLQFLWGRRWQDQPLWYWDAIPTHVGQEAPTSFDCYPRPTLVVIFSQLQRKTRTHDEVPMALVSVSSLLGLQYVFALQNWFAMPGPTSELIL